MKKQIDFVALLRQYFGDEPKKVAYELRNSCNLFPDLEFLSHLLHDARLDRKNASLRGKRLSIHLERECWELFSEKSEKLYVTRSKLTISPVKDVEWRLKHHLLNCEDKLDMHGIWLDLRDMNLVLQNPVGWECVISLGDEDWKVRLQDLEAPHPYEQDK